MMFRFYTSKYTYVSFVRVYKDVELYIAIKLTQKRCSIESPPQSNQSNQGTGIRVRVRVRVRD